MFRFELRESGGRAVPTHVSNHGKVPCGRHERLVGAVEVGADEGDGAAVAHLGHTRDALGRYVGA